MLAASGTQRHSQVHHGGHTRNTSAPPAPKAKGLAHISSAHARSEHDVSLALESGRVFDAAVGCAGAILAGRSFAGKNAWSKSLGLRLFAAALEVHQRTYGSTKRRALSEAIDTLAQHLANTCDKIDLTFLVAAARKAGFHGTIDKHFAPMKA